MRRLYLCGPMSGLSENNYPAFNAAAKLWRERGWCVMNPAELGAGHRDDPKWDDYMRIDIRYLSECDAVAVLHGWQNSNGAKLELFIAKSLGMQIYCNESAFELNLNFELAVKDKIEIILKRRNPPPEITSAADLEELVEKAWMYDQLNK